MVIASDASIPIATRYGRTIEPPEGVLAPAYMAFALPRGSALREGLDHALIEITASPEWRKIKQSYFGR